MLSKVVLHCHITDGRLTTMKSITYFYCTLVYIQLVYSSQKEASGSGIQSGAPLSEWDFLCFALGVFRSPRSCFWYHITVQTNERCIWTDFVMIKPVRCLNKENIKFGKEVICIFCRRQRIILRLVPFHEKLNRRVYELKR